LKRSLGSLAGPFDVLVIGAGSHGACAARDAAMRGLRVGLVDKGDFCGATSHNSLKLIHGGLRYLQHLDFRRVRQSVVERRFWLKTAPHLVRPLEFVIPAMGHGSRGPEALLAAMRMHEAIGFDRNAGLLPESRIPKGRILSKQEFLRRVPDLPSSRITGGAVWYDGQMFDADRVVLECIIDAVSAGAKVANYVTCEDVIRRDRQIIGARLRDGLTGETWDAPAKVIINAAGPWSGMLMNRLRGRPQHMPRLAENMNLVVRRDTLPGGYAIGLPSRHASDARLGSSQRLYFATPWFGLTVFGTTHVAAESTPDTYRVRESQIQDFIDELNAIYPPLALKREEIIYVYSGLTPAAEEGVERAEIKRLRHGLVVDHHGQDGLAGAISILSVKYTTARLLAEKAVDLACVQLGRSTLTCVSKTKALPGAVEYPGRKALIRQTQERMPRVSHHAVEELVTAYGVAAKEFGAAPENDPAPIDDEALWRARCRRAVTKEMAVTLEDVFVRRTTLAERGLASWDLIAWCAAMMQEELRWSRQRQNAQAVSLGQALGLARRPHDHGGDTLSKSQNLAAGA
jgi:glycerol-3-phosphate dehydrogenase